MAILRIPISDDDLLDGFTGKGGVLCSWIHVIEREGDVLAVEIDDPSVADMAPVEVPLHFRLSADDLAEAVSVVSQSGITRHTSWHDPETFDAHVVDVVIQQACFGEQVFG